MDTPLFLKVKCGDAVLYEKDQIGKVLTFVGGSRDPDAPSLLSNCQRRFWRNPLDSW